MAALKAKDSKTISLTLTPTRLAAERFGHRWWAAMQFRGWMALSISAAIALSYAATVVPMRIGARAFRELEV